MKPQRPFGAPFAIDFGWAIVLALAALLTVFAHCVRQLPTVYGDVPSGAAGDGREPSPPSD